MGDSAPVQAAAAPIDITIAASPSLAPLLAQLRTSLLVSTYEAGALVVVRALGGSLFIDMVRVDRAMGVAAIRNRLALGTRHRILEMSNMPVLSAQMPTAAGQPAPDACYVPLNTHVTGEIDLHEIAWGEDELWFVNTRFSCLCTRSALESFQPRWRPPFVKRLRPDDRCHLNGIAMDGGRPAYVTLFAATDEPEGWRAQRTTGGLVLDVASGEAVAHGLSMPHSPRLYRGELWVEESGRGTLARVDRAAGRCDTVAAFDGFTRGLDFVGGVAFVGLSKVRESRSFGGVPITERVDVDRRFCGVQAVDLATGRSLGFLQFETGVGEIFAVQALQGVVHPAFVEDADPLVGASYVLSPETLAQM
ncbi:MAG TPA: TIGR03032 family protein [Casimicrobiaceae bacterium]|nr:TIGR03032 family protein [Casimicrobiaceae bacterium]